MPVQLASPEWRNFGPASMPPWVMLCFVYILEEPTFLSSNIGYSRGLPNVS